MQWFYVNTGLRVSASTRLMPPVDGFSEMSEYFEKFSTIRGTNNVYGDKLQVGSLHYKRLVYDGVLQTDGVYCLLARCQYKYI